MHKLTLEWQEAGQLRRETICQQQQSKYPGVRLGRDPVRCDLVLSDPTVSGLHIEICFNPSLQAFVLRNLRHTNPPVVDGCQITQGEAPLSEGSIIYLGQVAMKVTAVTLAVTNRGISPTILVSPPVLAAVNQLTPAVASYGLQCPNCHRVSPFAQMPIGCSWCGVSLAAAESVLMTHNGN